MNIILGFIVGSVGGIGLVFLFENLNPRLYTLDQIEAVTELDVIGKIPLIKRNSLSGLRRNAPIINSFAYRESFHKLQTKIVQQSKNGHTTKSLLFTSAVPGEGKSTVVSNLGLAMGRAGQKVIIVDCDMRRPTQHKFFGLPNKFGLSTLLNQQTMQIDVLQKSRNPKDPNTWVLTSGPLPPNPIELLGSAQMKSLIEQLVQKFDFVLLDAPAILPVGDAIVLSSMVDTIALVTRQTYCKEEAVRDVCKQLADTNTKMAGVIVNGAKQVGGNYYYKE